MSREFLDIKEVEKVLRLSERTIFNLMKKGELTGFKIGRKWYFEPSEIDGYIDRQKQKAINDKNVA
jgi:putative molybdopterin biosynthesis protein